MIAHCSVRIMAKFLLIMLIFLAPLSAFASVINGKVEDLFGHPIEGVDIYIDNSRFAAKTNHMGEYKLPFVPGKLSVNIKKAGYTTETYSLDLYTDSDFPAKTVTLLQIPGDGIYLVDYDKSRYLWLPSDDCEVVHEEQRSPGLVLPRPVYYVRDLGDSTSIRPGEVSFLIIPPEGEDKNINVGLYRTMSSAKIYTGYAVGEGPFKGGQIATGLVGEQEHRSFGSEQLKVTTVNLVSGNYVFVRTSHDMMYDSWHPFTYDGKGGCAGLIVTRYAGASDDIDERSVWHPSEGLWEEVHSGCAQSGENLTDVECIGGEMSRLGASEEAIAFVIKMGGEAYLSHFDEHGIVDNGVVTYPVLNDPSVSEPVFINPNGHIIDDIYSLAKETDIREIDGYKQVVAKYPKAEIWPMSFFQSSASLPHGGQQFVYAFTLLDGCRACAIAGHAEIAFNFTSRGVLENVSPLGLKFVEVAAGSAAPANLTALATSNTQINLDWRDNNTNETGYYVERRVGTGAWSRIATLGANAAAYVSGGLTGSTTYSYRVQAYQAQGVTSAYSNEASATTPAGDLPQPRLNDTILSSMPYKPEILEDVKQAARVKDRLDQLSPLTMLWNTPLVSHGYGVYGTFTPPSIADGLIFTANGKTIYALQADHGQIIWQRELSWWVHQESPLDVSAGHVWVATGGDAYKLDMYTGNIVWRTRLPGNGTVTETQQVASKAVILGDGGLYVLNGSNGQMEWHNELAAGDGFASYKNYIYVGARNKTTASEQANGHRAGNSTDPEQLKITISSLKNKQQDWMAVSNEEQRSGTNTAQLDHEIDVLKKRISDLEQELTGKQMKNAEFDNATTKLIEFSIIDGKVEREYTVASWPRWKPTVHLGVIYFVDIGDTLHALNIDDWKLKWTKTLEGRTYSPPVVSRDVLYISTDHTYAIHAESGQVKWEQDFGIGTMAPLVDIHGIYVSATEYTENPSIASTIPPFTTGKKMAKDYNAKQIEEMESRFREVGNYQGNLIEDGFGYLSFIYRLDIESGRMIWKQRVASLVDSHCTPAEEEGVLFVGFNDGTFAAYQK